MRSAVVRPTGVGCVARDLALALCRAESDFKFRLFACSRRDRLPVSEYVDAGADIRDRRLPSRLVTWSFDRLNFPSVEALAGRCAIAHSFEPSPLPTRHARTVATVHDLFHVRHPEKTDPRVTGHLVRAFQTRLLLADRIVTVSDHVRAELLDVLPVEPGKVVTVHHGLRDDQRRQPTAEKRQELRQRLHLPSRFLLFVGTIEPRKNVCGLVRAFASLVRRGRNDGCYLVIAGGRGYLHEEELRAIAKEGVASTVRLFDYLEMGAVKVLMSLARGLVIPSLDEGFGLPLLEGLALGIPVATSDRGALPEVAGGAALHFAADDTERMADGLERLISDPALREELKRKGPIRAAQFRWETAAKKMLDLYRDLLGLEGHAVSD